MEVAGDVIEASSFQLVPTYHYHQLYKYVTLSYKVFFQTTRDLFDPS